MISIMQATPPSAAFPQDFNGELPDVLGMITGGLRLNIGLLQCAHALYPRTTTAGQPLEALLLLQNSSDKPLALTLTIRLPKRDSAGNRLTLWTPKEAISLTLQAAEVGLLHIPLVSRPPVQPCAGVPVTIKIDLKPAKGARQVRSSGHGRPAIALKLSPLHLSILREAGFGTTQHSDGSLQDTFDIVPGNIPTAPPPTAPRYESLWTVGDLALEQAQFEVLNTAAQQFAAAISHSILLEPLTRLVAGRFEQAGYPLHPGEAVHVAKVFGHILEDGLEQEAGFSLQASRWYQKLMGIMKQTQQHGGKTPDIIAMLPTLFPDLLHDSVRLGLAITARVSGESLGTVDEHESYANEVLSALGGKIPTVLGHAYFPLVLTGLLLNYHIRGAKENVWLSLNDLKGAWQLRAQATGDEGAWVGRVFRDFYEMAVETLEHARVPRPTKMPRPDINPDIR